jgi:transposase
MRVRRQTVEHPFETLKPWMGRAHVMTKTLDRVSTEMSLHVLGTTTRRYCQIPAAFFTVWAVGGLSIWE